MSLATSGNEELGDEEEEEEGQMNDQGVKEESQVSSTLN